MSVLMSKAAFSRHAGVTPAAVTTASKHGLKSCLVEGKINREAPAALEYVKLHALRRFKKCAYAGDVLAAAMDDGRSNAERMAGALNVPLGDMRRLCEDIEILYGIPRKPHNRGIGGAERIEAERQRGANPIMGLGDSPPGDMTLKEYADIRAKIATTNEKEIKLALSASRLVSLDLMDRAVFAEAREAAKQLLVEVPVAVARILKGKREPTELEIRKVIRHANSKVVRLAIESSRRNLEDVLKGGKK